MKSITLSEDKKSVCVLLNKSFYRKEVIEQGRKAFKNIAKSSLTDSKNYYEITLIKKTKEITLEDLGLGFCNYALEYRQNME